MTEIYTELLYLVDNFEVSKSNYYTKSDWYQNYITMAVILTKHITFMIQDNLPSYFDMFDEQRQAIMRFMYMSHEERYELV